MRCSLGARPLRIYAAAPIIRHLGRDPDRIMMDDLDRSLEPFHRTGWRDIARWDSVLKVVCISEGYLARHAGLEDLRAPYFGTKHVPSRHVQEDHTADNNARGRRLSLGRLQGRPKSDFASWRAYAHSTAALNRAWPSVRGSSRATRANEPRPLSTENPVLRSFGSTTKGVETFRIDHAEGVAILTTGRRRKISVVSLKTGAVLASGSFPRRIAHLDADQGWVVFLSSATTFDVRQFESLDTGTQPSRGSLKHMRMLSCAPGISHSKLRFPYLTM